MPAPSPADVIRCFADYLRAGDLDSLHGLYEDEAIYFVAPDSPVRGAAIREALRRLIAGRGRMDATCAGVIESGGLALVNNRWSLTITRAGGEVAKVGGVSAVVLRQRPDGWRIVIDYPWMDGPGGRAFLSRTDADS